MIKKIECFVAICDVCGKSTDDGADIIPHYDTEKTALECALDIQNHGGSGCKEIDGKLCCSGCWVYNDDDEIAIRPKADTEI